VKTKADSKKVEDCFTFNRIPAGSFRSFCNIYNFKKPDQKMYLVILPRKAETGVHPVTIAEIDSVIPRARDRAFNTNLTNNISFGTYVQLKPGTKTLWFDLPEQTGDISMNEVAKKVFIERFSKNKLVSLENAQKRVSHVENDRLNMTALSKSVKTTALSRLLSSTPILRMTWNNTRPFLDPYGQYEMDTRQCDLNENNLFRFYEEHYNFCFPVSNHPQFRELFRTNSTTTHSERTVKRYTDKSDNSFGELLRRDDYPAYCMFSSLIFTLLTRRCD
jgi:hypothetical protein